MKSSLSHSKVFFAFLQNLIFTRIELLKEQCDLVLYKLSGKPKEVIFGFGFHLPQGKEVVLCTRT